MPDTLLLSFNLTDELIYTFIYLFSTLELDLAFTVSPCPKACERMTPLLYINTISITFPTDFTVLGVFHTD